MATGGSLDILIDDNITSLARFAVHEYNKEQHTHLQFKGLWSVKSRVMVGSTRYYLTLDAGDGGEINKYEAEVIVIVTRTPLKKLVVFKPILQA